MEFSTHLTQSKCHTGRDIWRKEVSKWFSLDVQFVMCFRIAKPDLELDCTAVLIYPDPR